MVTEQCGEKKNIMVAIDESESSQYALEWALRYLQESMERSKLFILTAQNVDTFGYVYASSFGAAPLEMIQTVEENHKKFVEALFQTAKDIFIKYGIEAETMTEMGDPKEVICNAVDKLNIHLLVMGTYSRDTSKRGFLGSVSKYCVHNAKCPVLLVRKKD